jgi:hypothetical protein
MSIRILARELYQTTKVLEELEQRLRGPALKTTEKLRLEEEIRTIRAEHERLKAMLEGAKDG